MKKGDLCIVVGVGCDCALQDLGKIFEALDVFTSECHCHLCGKEFPASEVVLINADTVKKVSWLKKIDGGDVKNEDDVVVEKALFSLVEELSSSFETAWDKLPDHKNGWDKECVRALWFQKGLEQALERVQEEIQSRAPSQRL